jgi:AraC family transcriptional activator FtrA
MVHRVAALAHAPQSMFELACAAEVFGLYRPGLPEPYQFEVCAENPGPLATLAGFDMLVTNDLSALRRADTIVIPGWQTYTEPAPPAIVRALQQAHRRGTRIITICSGVFPLAQTGLLDGRRATTHWALVADLTIRFPNVQVDPDVLYVDHGDVASSAGAGAGIDLCLHVVRVDHGAAHAAHVARHMVMPPHREGGQRQYAELPTSGPVPDSLAPLLDWATARLHEPLTINDLAAKAQVSGRTLTRRFATQLGTSPGQWLLAQRIAASRALLEETDLSVEAIADRVGLSSAVNLRRRFHQAVRTTPAAYRRTFHQARTS